MTKQEAEDIIERCEALAKRSKKFNAKIDKLAKDYFKDVLQTSESEEPFKSDGYYAILHHCIDKIQCDDQNSSFGLFANNKKEDKYEIKLKDRR